MSASSTSIESRAVAIRVVMVLVGLLLVGKAFHLQVGSSPNLHCLFP